MSSPVFSFSSQARKMKSAEEISDDLLCVLMILWLKTKIFFPSPVIDPEAKATFVHEEDYGKWGVGREQLVETQKSNVLLSHCIAAAVDKLQLPQYSVAYFFDEDVLMCKWIP